MILVPNRSLEINKLVSIYPDYRIKFARIDNVPLSSELIHHFGTGNAFGETREVLDVSSGGELTARGETKGNVSLDYRAM